MHRVLAFASFAVVVIAMMAYSVLGLPSDYRYQRAIRMWAILVSIFALLTFMLLARLPPSSPYYGRIQKLLIALVVAWGLMSIWALN